MKKFFLSFAVTTISTVMFMNADAQNGMKALATNDSNALAMNNSKDAMDIVSIVDAPYAEYNDNSTLKDINLKALKDFKKTFAARNKTWQKVAGGFLASFSLGEIKNVVAYNNKGKWQYTIRTYSEDRLPHGVRATVKQTYYDYSITQVQEIHIDNQIVYLIHMQDATTWKIVRVSDGEMELVKDINKG